MNMKHHGRSRVLGFLSAAGFFLLPRIVDAAANMPKMTLSIGGGDSGPAELTSAMKIFIFMTLLSVGPAILLTMTSFTRIVVVLSFVRQAIGVHQSPPNQVVVGLALFLTAFLMSPVFKQINDNAYKPMMEQKIGQDEAFKQASTPLKKFMFAQTHRSDLDLLFRISKTEPPKDLESLSLTIIIPAYILSELKTSFEIGFMIYLPFVLIDMVISMVLLTMGMMMLPPVVISLPFKLMLFVLVDGWNLIVGSLMESFK